MSRLYGHFLVRFHLPDGLFFILEICVIQFIRLNSKGIKNIYLKANHDADRLKDVTETNFLINYLGCSIIKVL